MSGKKRQGSGHLRQDLPEEEVVRAGYLCVATGELHDSAHFSDTACCDVVYTVKQLLDGGYTLLDPNGRDVCAADGETHAGDEPAETGSGPRSRPSALAEQLV